MNGAQRLRPGPRRSAILTLLPAGLLVTGLVAPGCTCSPTDLHPEQEVPFDQAIDFPLANYAIQQNFAHRAAWNDDKYHAAEDVVGTAGTPVYAVADGQVAFSGRATGYGWLIVIDHPGGIYSLYGHLSTRREKVLAGGEVTRGQLIGYLADDDEDGSGDEYPGGAYPYWAPHLHFALRAGRISDYPESGDDRWEAGYTYAHPADLGWLAPRAFILQHR